MPRVFTTARHVMVPSTANDSSWWVGGNSGVWRGSDVFDPLCDTHIDLGSA